MNSQDTDAMKNAQQTVTDEVDLQRKDSALMLKSVTTTAVIVGAVLMLLSTVHPELILKNNTPTGGDMGAHVWGPAYLRDVLLPHWRITGWSMDWYAGLPTYRFYMVVPALMIVLLDLILPYGIAFKIIVVLGIVTLPLCAWAMGKFARLAYPIPELFAVAAVLFLYDESFTIYGGNIASTMAGEFSFSIAFAIAFLAFGLFARGLDDGKYRGVAAVAISLSALCHGIVLIFVFLGVGLMLLLRLDRQRLRYGITTISTALLLSAFWVVPFLGGHSVMTDMKYEPRPSGGNDSLWKMLFPFVPAWNILLVGLSIVAFVASIKQRRFIGIWMGVYSIVLMIGVKVAQQSLPVIGLLWNPRLLPFVYVLRYMLAVMGAYEVCVFLFRFVRLQRYARTAIARSEFDAENEDVPQVRRPSLEIGMNSSTRVLWLVTLFALVVLGFRYQQLPGGRFVTSGSKTKYAWGPIQVPASRGFSDGWARWNFQGYEGKSSYGEYHGVVQTMLKLGDDPAHGCGRAVWENNGELNKYGTTMGLMLLPFWTKGCIASMEGLFFEASGTTPYHFVTAAAVSKQSSNPVRELRYDNNVAAKGVAYLQQLGVRYLMVFTPEALAQAKTRPDLTQVGVSGPWHVFEVANTQLVVPLSTQPVVVAKRTGDQRERWLELGMSYFQHTDEWDALPVASGPASWQHIEVEPDLKRRQGESGEPGRLVDIVVPVADTKIAPVTVEPAIVTDIKIDNEAISFHVDKIGVPVLVRVSYYPNWKSHGASAPMRAAPNMMVVVPTTNNVRLTYDSSGTDKLAYLLTFIGIGLVVFFVRRPLRYGVAMPPRD